jgi:hypothetical protein
MIQMERPKKKVSFNEQIEEEPIQEESEEPAQDEPEEPVQDEPIDEPELESQEEEPTPKDVKKPKQVIEEEDEEIEEDSVPVKKTPKTPQSKYSKLTLKQLQALLKERNIPGRSKFKSKETIIPVLEDNDKSGVVYEANPPKKSKTASKKKESVEPIEEDAEIETYTKQLLETLRKMKKHALNQDSEFKTGFAEYMKSLCEQMEDYQSSM